MLGGKDDDVKLTPGVSSYALPVRYANEWPLIGAATTLPIYLLSTSKPNTTSIILLIITRLESTFGISREDRVERAHHSTFVQVS